MKYIEYLEKLDYPEYARSNGNGSTVNLSLLDLSMDDSSVIDKLAIELLKTDDVSLGKYTFSQDFELIEQLSIENRVDKNNIIITSGCDGALRVVFQGLVHAGTNISIPIPSFGRYEYHSKVNNANIDYINFPKFPHFFEVDVIVERAKRNKSEVIVLANPNNPTGIFISPQKIEYILSRFEGHLILDEALVDYKQDISSNNLISKSDKLVILKSFSKAYGIAGLRVGCIITQSRLANSFRKLVSPFELTSLSVKLALHLLKNKTYRDNRIREVQTGIDLLKNELDNSYFDMTSTCCSTCLINHQGFTNLHEFLLNNGVKTVNACSFRGLDNSNSVRVSIKDSHAIKDLLSVLKRLNM